MHSNILCAMWNEIDFDCNAKIMLRIANSIVYMPDFAVSSDHCPCSTTAELKRFPLVFAQVHLHQTQIISLKSCWFWTFQTFRDNLYYRDTALSFVWRDSEEQSCRWENWWISQCSCLIGVNDRHNTELEKQVNIIFFLSVSSPTI